MSSIDESLRSISERVKTHANTLLTEEAVKTAVVLPFLRTLGYDVFDPSEVIPEFTADAVGKKGEKVDYAVKIDGDIRILIECKPITTALEKKHLDQLYRYFSVTNAKFAILTNGEKFNFYTDLESPNRLDTRPFFVFDALDYNSSVLTELKKFEKNSFNEENILATAERLKYTSGIKQAIHKLIENPSEDFVRIVSASAYEGRLTAPVREMLSEVTKTAFREVIMDAVKSRLTNALAETDPKPSNDEPPIEISPDIITTQEEIEGYMIVKAIVREAVSANRVVMRDAKSYCAVLLDDNNRKPLVRLHFNRTTKYIGLFDGENEDKIAIDGLDQIYDFSDRIKLTALKYG